MLAIEDDYVGPQLENGKVTLKFMEELMEFYKDQKRLHRKFAYKVCSFSGFSRCIAYRASSQQSS